MSLDHTMNTNSSSFRSVERTSGKAAVLGEDHSAISNKLPNHDKVNQIGRVCVCSALASANSRSGTYRRVLGGVWQRHFLPRRVLSPSGAPVEIPLISCERQWPR